MFSTSAITLDPSKAQETGTGNSHRKEAPQRYCYTSYLHIYACTACTVECNTLAVLNIEPPEPENGGSIGETPINLFHLLIMHIVDGIC
jgi:hypothetical protein